MSPDKGDEITAGPVMSTVKSEDLEQFHERMAEILRKYPSYDTKYSLERWLNAHNCDIEKAAGQMRRALNALDVIGAFREYDSAESLNNLLYSLNPAAEYFPGGIMGSDERGNIICVQPMGRARPRTVMRLGRVSDLYRAAILEGEACMTLLRQEEAKRGCKLGIILISDLCELSPETVYMPAVRAYLNVLPVLQYLFPDTVKKVYVINSPGAMNILFKMAKHVLSKGMLEKIEFLGSDWKQQLKAELGEENIFKHWGGTKEATKETGTIRMGGEVPEILRDEIAKTIKIIPADQLTKATIPPGEALKIPFTVSRTNSLLQWYFTVSTGEINFKITLDENEVWPVFRLSTEFVPEYGELLCQNTGQYVFHFDSTATLFSKTLAYTISVKDPEAVVTGQSAKAGNS